MAAHGWLESLMGALKIAEQKSNEKYARWLDGMIQSIFAYVIETWYASYHPRYYQRNESLYDILETSPADGGYVDFRVSSDHITPTRGGNKDYIYILTYRQGWHGGAWSSVGIGPSAPPRYRTPYKRWDYWGTIAAHSPAPRDEFQRVLDRILDDDTRNGTYGEIATEETNKALQKVGW